MGTESHGSDFIFLTPRARFFLRFVKTADLKDSRAAESDIVMVTNGIARFLFPDP